MKKIILTLIISLASLSLVACNQKEHKELGTSIISQTNAIDNLDYTYSINEDGDTKYLYASITNTSNHEIEISYYDRLSVFKINGRDLPSDVLDDKITKKLKPGETIYDKHIQSKDLKDFENGKVIFQIEVDGSNSSNTFNF